MTKIKKNIIKIVSLIGASCLLMGGCAESFNIKDGTQSASVKPITLTNGDIYTGAENFFDKNVVTKLSDVASESEEISVIITMEAQSIMDAYQSSNSTVTLNEYVLSEQAQRLASNIEKSHNALIKRLNKSKIEYQLGERYDTILNGFEVVINSKDFESLYDLVGEEASLIVGETYEKAETEIVTNEVDVYETGIFDSSSSEYQGDGVVVAVLDTGLDYTHTAFSVDNFTTTNEAFTLQTVSNKVNETVASTYTGGLTGADVYVSKKVPYAYDYADKDPDVLPINSEHGTHVAGVIAGKDDTITGVAPNAQLAIMKVFSDTQDGAKTSWILSALEDCVILGVDVINMSLGSSCGFSREVDDVKVNEVYDKIREAGISLICAASNDYNATFSSDKNGSNALTSNPDSGTVGSPSTYSAALSVASVDGVKTPYLLFGEEIIYFNEASTSSAKTKDFVDDILNTLGPDVYSHDFEYVTIPGIGRESDYPEESDFYKGKIVLVKRGTTTFEDKVRIALKVKGAAGIIIYNNVSGTISMSVGADVGAVCSISQDQGEMLAKAGTGILKISRDQVAGPFMSDFSSWGPTSDLKIKPEITAHGGEILSAVPGQEYDRLSGTSMAAPNQAGAAALIRQYVKYSNAFGSDINSIEVTDLVNQLMMSTADIVYNKNGLPYAVRKQGSGLVNITKSYTSASYITTYDVDGNKMNKTKLELGDDKSKSGVYEMKFDINNISGSSVTYDVNSIIMTEGVSSTYTSHSDTTITQDGYLLEGTQTEVTSVSGGSNNGNTVTVSANSSATVTVKVTLSDEDKKYMNESFAHGMYVEGFITLTASAGTEVSMNVPVLAFYGDWTEAPIFDEEYYDTHKDEIDAGKDESDKLMADAYATRAIGGLYTDYIATLGSYYFDQNPAATQIAATKEHIAISNQESTTNATVNSLKYIWAGMLRNAKEVNISIVEDSTGKEIFNKTQYNQRKSYSRGGNIYYSSIDVDFSTLANNLKNNTKYTVTVSSYIDYGNKEDQNNVRNTFEFPLFIDFEAPIITDVTYRTEYDRTSKETHLFADLSVYDNHYAMALQMGQIVEADPSTGYTFSMQSFGKYMTPVYSSFNSTSTVSIEITDYVAQMKNSAGLSYNPDGSYDVVYNNNSFIATCYDYAMNSATYEIRLPDEVLSMYFNSEEVSLSPNETLDVSTILNIYPNETWIQTLDFSSSNSDYVEVVNQTIIAKADGKGNSAVVTATGYDTNGNKVSTSIKVNILKEGDEGYVGSYSIPEVNNFTLTGYHTNKAFYSVTSDEREIGLTDGDYSFDGNYTLSMYPSESVTLKYVLDSYFPEKTDVTFKVGSNKIASVDENGTIVALAEGTTIVNVNVTYEGKQTLYSGRVAITVKDPYTTNSIYLMSYRGLGGVVEIPDDRGVTTIYSFAFSHYEYIDKDLDAGDVIDEEDPYYIKQWYIGDNTITKVIIPEGVEIINSYAFANLTALEEVVLPSTLTTIGVGAFYGCENLKTINLNNVKFINENAFYGCALEEVELDSVVAIGNFTFAENNLNYIELPKSSQSLGIGAFYGNDYLNSVEFEASKIKIGSYTFAECPTLTSININAAVISSYAFYNCSSLQSVTLGKDVSVIGEFAFAGTNISAFDLDVNNTTFTTSNNGAMILNGTELVLVAPNYSGSGNKIVTDATSIATGAFSGNTKVFFVEANKVTKVGPYAFAYCTNLKQVTMNNVEVIEEYAFCETNISATPNLNKVTLIGAYAFAGSPITTLTIGNNVEIENYAFTLCTELTEVVLGDNVTVGEGAFYNPIALGTYDQLGTFDYYTSYKYEVKDEEGNVVNTYYYYSYNFAAGVYSNLNSVEIGDNVVLNAYAFAGNANLETLTFGDNAYVGNYAFFNAAALTNVDLSKVSYIGDYAFSGTSQRDYWLNNNTWNYAFVIEYVDGEEVYTGYKFTQFAAQFATADLSNATYIGEGAFYGNAALNEVTFGEKLTKISSFAFANNTNLAQITIPENIVELGDYAFYGTAVTNVDLSSVTTIGGYAFARTNLTKVTLKENATVGDGAFAYCDDLAEVINMDKVSYIGASAFVNVALTEVNVQNATYIGDFAFSNSSVEKVVFGDKLAELGENPFYACEIKTFGKEEDVLFNNVVVGTTITPDYNISETVKVIGEVLYQVVPNGLELVSYPMAKDSTSYVVEEGTVRISARAFAYSNLNSVTLASTLKSLGDKAFYGCKNLTIVVFLSYEAPALEEEFDEAYFASYQNLPIPGYMGEYKGLGISKFYIWNVASSQTNTYYGANFVNYVGKVSDKLIMVKPANGQNYDTFIFSQYFGTTVLGTNAAIESTLNVIALIDAIPANITLACEDAIVAARTAYDNITTVEQQALVYNYSTLVNAESLLEYLKSRVPTPGPVTDIPPVKPTTEPYVYVIIAVSAAVVVAAAAVVAVLLIKKYKNKK